MSAPTSPQHITLAHGRLTATIAPAAGGSVARFDADGQPMMRPADNLHSTDPLAMACYPLLPFVGRIAFGHFRFEGQEVTLPPHPISTPHALHGLGWQRPWEVAEVSDTHAVLVLHHDANTHEADWPWHFEARETFVLDETALTITLDIINRAATAMPGGLGLHPFFPDRLNARLTSALPFIWEATPEALPTNRSAVTAVRNFKGGRRIAPLTLDHCFSGGEGPLDIAWEDRALGLRLTGPDGKRAAAHTVIYTPQAHDFFCVEPVSHAPNAVNLPDSADITSLTILKPGARMTLACRFEVRGL